MVAKSVIEVMLSNPVSFNHQPVPLELVELLEEIQTLAGLSGVTVFEDELADLPAGSEGDAAFVLDDPTPANNGVYLKGASVWAKTSDLPAGFTGTTATEALAALEAHEGETNPHGLTAADLGLDDIPADIGAYGARILAAEGTGAANAGRLSVVEAKATSNAARLTDAEATVVADGTRLTVNEASIEALDAAL